MRTYSWKNERLDIYVKRIVEVLYNFQVTSFNPQTNIFIVITGNKNDLRYTRLYELPYQI